MFLIPKEQLFPLSLSVSLPAPLTPAVSWNCPCSRLGGSLAEFPAPEPAQAVIQQEFQ